MNSPITKKSFILRNSKDEYLFSWGRQFNHSALTYLKGNYESMSCDTLWDQLGP